MTQLTNPATHNHPNFVRAQAASAASRLGDYAPTFDMLAEEENPFMPEPARGTSRAARRTWP